MGSEMNKAIENSVWSMKMENFSTILFPRLRSADGVTGIYPVTDPAMRVSNAIFSQPGSNWPTISWRFEFRDCPASSAAKRFAPRAVSRSSLLVEISTMPGPILSKTLQQVSASLGSADAPRARRVLLKRLRLRSIKQQSDAFNEREREREREKCSAAGKDNSHAALYVPAGNAAPTPHPNGPR